MQERKINKRIDFILSDLYAIELILPSPPASLLEERGANADNFPELLPSPFWKGARGEELT